MWKFLLHDRFVQRTSSLMDSCFQVTQPRKTTFVSWHVPTNLKANDGCLQAFNIQHIFDAALLRVLDGCSGASGAAPLPDVLCDDGVSSKRHAGTPLLEVSRSTAQASTIPQDDIAKYEWIGLSRK